MRRVIACTAVLLLALLVWQGAPASGQPATRALILSWDGTSGPFVGEMLAQGKLPNLARLIAGGVFADAVTTAFPSKTAAGHASLWTGAPAGVTGIAGNTVPRTPRRDHTILEGTSGFSSTSLRAEPLWMAAARSGRRAVIVQATQGWPPEPYTADGPFGPGQASRLVLFEGYAGIVGGEGVVTARQAAPRPVEGWTNVPTSAAPPREIAFTVGTTQLFGLLIDDAADPARGYDTVLVARVKDAARAEARLKPGLSSAGTLDKWSATIEVESGRVSGAGTYLRLFDLRPDGSDFLLYFTRPVRELSSIPELTFGMRAAAGVFIGNGASGPYGRGDFGPTIPRGGDGTAERRYLETVRLTQRQLIEATRWAARTLPWDLLFTYTPYPDESEHQWRGYLEASLPGHRSEIAGRLRPFLEEVYQTCDEFLGLLLSVRPPNTIVALVSDHGLEGLNKVVNINTVLQQAGLLVLDEQGRVDLTRTKALYFSGNNAYILINSTDRKGGIVPPADRAQVVAQIRGAMAQVRDGDRAVVTGIFDALTEGEAMGIGGEAGGDIYLDLLPGYNFDARLGVREVIASRDPFGDHVFNPARVSMRTIMVLNGPGIRTGARLPQARTIDLAPTLAHLLDIARPQHARGRVLNEAVTR